MPAPDSDWLDEPVEYVNVPEHTGTKRNPVIEALYDTVSPMEVNPIVPKSLPTAQHALVRALRRLRPQQRIFIRALLVNQCNVTKTIRALRARGLRYSQNMATQWMRSTDYKFALNALKEHFLDTAGIDPAGLLIRTADIIDSAMEGDVVLHQGLPVLDQRGIPMKVADRGAALKGIELVARHHKMFGDEKTTRVTVQVIELDGEKHIEGEVIEHE